METFDQNYNDLIKSIGFHHLFFIRNNPTKRRFLSVGEINGKKRLLKIIPSSDSQRKALFEKEERVSKILASSPSLKAVRVLGLGHYGEFVYMLRDFVEGQSLANYDENKSLYGFDEINANYLNNFSILDQIIAIIQDIQAQKEAFLQDFDDRYVSRFPKKFDQEKIQQIENSTGVKLSNQLNFLQQHQDVLLDKGSTVFMGDLTPANLIITSNNQVYVSDYEQFALDSYMLDFAHFYIFLWRYPDWQKYLLYKIIASDDDKMSFVFCLTRVLFHLYDWPYLSLPDKAGVDRNQFIRNHPWTKILQKCAQPDGLFD